MPTIFKSIHHPGDTPTGIVYSHFLARPLGVCTIPLMIGATTSALLGEPIYGYLVWGLPAAIGIATVWAHFAMSRAVAELALESGQAAIRSVHDVLQEQSRTWEPIYTVRSTSWNTEISIGRTTHVLQPKDWPQYKQLEQVAQQAFAPHESSASGS